MLKITVAGAALVAATFATSVTPALANVSSGMTAAKIEAGAGSAVQPVQYYARRYGYGYGRGPYWRHRAWGWRRPYAYGGYYPGYYGWGYPAGYWGYPGYGYGYGWGPGLSVGIAPGFGIGFGF